tara:strand:- start:81 stop:392 length:312 start_codon:yes stop_codon:yes gene_type:complete
MKEFKGTQGEWKIVSLHSKHETIVATSTHRIAEAKHYHEKISATLLEPTEEEGKANAKLIAAAPKLLKALIKINELAECSDDRFSNYSDEIYNYSSEAINKAL